MASGSAAVTLAFLDETRPFPVDAAVWERNLAALRAVQPDLAADLERTPLPIAWRPALALDDFATWRLEEPGQPPVWLGGSAAPRARARALLDHFDPAGKNPALPCLGCGAELRVLLERLPPYAATFVFEQDPRVVAAVLRTQDYATAIAGGRCIFVPAGAEAASLQWRLEQQPGLLPPGDIVLPNLADEARVTELRLTCEGVLAKVQVQRDAEIRELRARSAAGVPAELTQSPRLAILALAPDTATHDIARSLELAAKGLGWDVACRVMDHPAHVHPVTHCRRLSEFHPTLTICVNHPRSWLPIALPGHACVWVLTENAARSDPPEDGVIYLAASPLIRTALTHAGAPAAATRDCYWACDPPPDDSADAAPLAAVVLVADRPPVSAKVHGITHSAHELLWTRLREVATQAWTTPLILQPAKLLVRAERECRIELTDPELRASFLTLIERVVVPDVIVEQAARSLAELSLEVLTLGYGWEDYGERNFKPLARSWFELHARGSDVNPRAWVFAGQNDPLGPALLHAAASGRPIWLHTPGGRALDAKLGDVLRAGQHYYTFSDSTELKRGVQALAGAPQALQKIAARARQAVTKHHSYAGRLQELVTWLSGVPAERKK